MKKKKILLQILGEHAEPVIRTELGYFVPLLKTRNIELSVETGDEH